MSLGRWLLAVRLSILMSLSGVMAAHSSTYEHDALRVNRPFDMADLLVQDELGYDCIPEARLDDAYFASGKGVRLPQTCLPAPCLRALSPAELGQLIGRPAYREEWDTYYARYAEHCRKETTPYGTPDGAPVVAYPTTPLDFWRPLLPPYAVALGGPGKSGGVSGGSGGGIPVWGASGGSGTGQAGPKPVDVVTGGNGGSGTPTGKPPHLPNTPEPPGVVVRPEGPTSEGPPGGGTPPLLPPGDGTPPQLPPFNTPAPVPLPAAFWMLMAGLVILGGAARRRRDPDAAS